MQHGYTNYNKFWQIRGALDTKSACMTETVQYICMYMCNFLFQRFLQNEPVEKYPAGE